ncbi:MAG TPA: flagellar hook-associated protein FlgK [Gemmatimonadaceae bacterium]|nr:flagellar hook-associated protein FlgK [Gemmatimonadaceae bacterium]
MSIGSILSMARTAMNAQQTAVQVASQNISNAQTDGYTRQRIELTASVPTTYPWGTVGNGVSIADVTRTRDALLDQSYRSAAADQSSANATSTALQQVQTIFNEPSDNGLSATLDKFWNSWSDLANDPTNQAAKSVVLSSGQDVATQLNQYASQLDAADQQNRQAMKTDVDRVNQLTQQIADLNPKILSAESGGHSANDLRDARDSALDELAKLAGATVVERENGTVGVYAAGRLLVDGSSAKTLELSNGNPPAITSPGSTAPLAGLGGSLGAELDLSMNRIPGVMSQLDGLASAIVTNVNAIHSTGTTYRGNPPVASPAGNFFDVTTPPPSGGDPRLTARGIRISPTIASATDVAAAAGGDPGPGNNAIALSLAQLKDSTVAFTSPSGASLGTNTIGGFYQQTIGDLATATRHAQDDETVQNTMLGNVTTRRQSTTGVSTDEELIDIIQHQHSYQAAARLVNVVDEMTQTLVQLGQ